MGYICCTSWSLASDNDTSVDILNHNAIFNTKVHEFHQELGDQHPEVFISLVQTYLTSMYGSNLWDLYSCSADKLYSAWNFLIKDVYKLPYATHRHIAYNITDKTHLRVSLLRRFINFYKKLEMCSKPEILHLFYLQHTNQRSAFGRNCANICSEFKATSIKDLNYGDISMPELMDNTQAYRIPLLKELLNLTNNTNCELPQIGSAHVIDFICCQ